MSRLSKIKDTAVADVYKMKKIHKFVPKSVSSRVGRSSLVVSKHSPTILFGAGLIGFGATVVLACRATLQLEEVLDNTAEDIALAHEAKKIKPGYTEADHKHDIAYVRIRSGMAIFKLYAPSIIVGSLSVAALTGSHNIMSKRNAGLTAAYAATEKAFAEYRARVEAEFGEDKERELRHGVQENTILEETDGGPKKKKVRGFEGASQYAIVFEEGATSNWEPTPEYNILFLRTVQNHLNDQLNANGHVLLNDAYEALGYPRTTAGAVVGWVRNNPNYSDTDAAVIDFGVFTDHNRDRIRDFVKGDSGSLLIDFNVDGVVYDLIDAQKKGRVRR